MNFHDRYHQNNNNKIYLHGLLIINTVIPVIIGTFKISLSSFLFHTLAALDFLTIYFKN
jgi:hypothetical protein